MAPCREKRQNHLHSQSQSSTHTVSGVSHKANEVKANGGRERGRGTRPGCHPPDGPARPRDAGALTEHRGDGQARNNLITRPRGLRVTCGHGDALRARGPASVSAREAPHALPPGAGPPHGSRRQVPATACPPRTRQSPHTATTWQENIGQHEKCYKTQVYKRKHGHGCL